MTEKESAFWSRVLVTNKISDCWEWTGAKTKNGYGNVHIGKRNTSAHRVAFEYANGPIPGEYLVCHICDNRLCCNPCHLMLGTKKSNYADMIIKNRGGHGKNKAVGERCHRSSLTDEKIREIRRLYKGGGVSQESIGKRYGITQGAVGHIIRGLTWKHVE